MIRFLWISTILYLFSCSDPAASLEKSEKKENIKLLRTVNKQIQTLDSLKEESFERERKLDSLDF